MTGKASHTIDTITEHACLLGEGPVWNEKRKCIYWVDVLNGKIHQFFPASGKHQTLDVGQMVGCIAVSSEGDFIAGLKNGIAFIDPKRGTVEMIATPEQDLPNNRFNDGKCDPAGRFWAGTMSLTENNRAGNLYRIDSDGSVRKMIEGVTISNGLAWTKDKKKFYYIDTPTQEVVAYDFNADTGNIKNKRSVIKIPQDEGFPDGMTIDSDDMLWIAHWGGWQVSRWNPSTGEKLLYISLPAAKITSCTFGGDFFQDLYITSAKVHLGEAELRAQPLAGSLFVVRNCGYSGLPAIEYRCNI